MSAAGVFGAIIARSPAAADCGAHASTPPPPKTRKYGGRNAREGVLRFYANPSCFGPFFRGAGMQLKVARAWPDQNGDRTSLSTFFTFSQSTLIVSQLRIDDRSSGHRNVISDLLLIDIRFFDAYLVRFCRNLPHKQQ